MCAWTIGRTRRVIYVNVLLWICILYGVLSAKAHKRSGTLGRNDTSFVRQDGFTQKKPRSAQYGGFIPRIQTVYPRQRAPVRLATIPINAGYRLPITQRLANVAPLTSLPGIPRTYVPVISTVPSIRYPLLRQSGLTGQYVVPYTLKMPAPNLPAAAPQVNEDLGKHYNEKYNTLPAASEIDLAQDGLNMPRKTETKKVDIGDEFDNFLESLDGPCSKHPCKNGAKCRMSHGGTSFHCICKRGYRGKTCEEKNECFPNPCENNGECTLTSEGFECSCSKRFKGKKCEQINTCEPNPCQHDGVCTELTNGGFECTCKKGHFGDKCQVSKQGCSPNPCRNDGQCREKDNGGFECICPQGYTGENCDRPNNKCFNNPCKNGGSCMQAMTSTGYECACARGFRGTNCEDHSGCDVASCQNGGTCYETEFGVRCICRNGYSGDKCQIRKFCEADTCQNNGKCIEHVRGFRCVCPEGYKGKMCDEIDNCRPNPCQHGGHCEQSESGYFCKCTAQYHGRNCEVSNPCARNPCKNGGKCTSDFDGQQYQCQCPEGFRGTNCEERNLCAPNPCENDGVCRSVGSEFGSEFSCECRNGFGGKTCAEKDPCLNNPCVNEGVCSRVGNNDFTCSCPDDYKGVRCEVKRHCRPNPCLNDGVCQESGDDFVCSCKEGFRGQRCEEQDQCVPNPCKNDGRCVSVGLNGNRRAFVCECANSFFGDTCEERNPCHPNPCGNQGQCTEINGGFTCQCKAGYKGDRCREIDKCNPNPCQHQGSCTEIIGGMGYACKCAYGYKGKDCEQKDYCHPNPCEHEGQCSLVDNESGYQCKCAPGYMGLRCSESNPCEPNPCLHDSHCILFPGFGKNHECNCTIGWSGDTCEKREICRPNPCQFGTKCIETGDDSYSCVKSMCHPNPCQNSGKCINVNENNFQCACNDDYEGKTCEVPRKHSQLSLVPSPPQSPYPQRLPTVSAGTPPSLQLVKSSPQVSTQLDASNMKSDKPPSIPMSSIASCSPFLCQNEGVCIQEAGRPIRCRCPPMYTGETCAVDKCHDNPCKNDGVCLPVKRQPGFVCKCKDGLTGPLCDSRPCEPNPCKNNGKCVMFYSVYLCKCKTGFRGKLCEETNDGRVVAGTEAPKKLEPAQSMILKTSQAVSPCSPSPCKNSAQCLETSDGEYECICTRDFSGPRCEEKGQFKYSSAPKFFPGRNEECEHCDRNARCVNGHCICKNKYVGDGLECWERTEKDDNWNCQVNPCKNGGTCKEGRSGCVCRLGFSGDYCEEYSPPVVHLTFDRLEDGERVRDMSGNGNDGLINQGFQITPGAGKCDNAGNLNGGDIIFDGENFRGIPRKAITIAVWVKLSTALGIQSIFDTVGSHSRHKDGQYHFEIDNGRVRWFHRNEDGKTVFSAVTDDIVVREGNWNLITGTYSVDRNRARIYVNGDMKKETNGKKMSLSGDWGFKAGIATLPELDVPDKDELQDDDDDTTTNNNNYYRNNIITHKPSFSNNDMLSDMLSRRDKQFNKIKYDNDIITDNNNNDENLNNNKGFIEKILNKDKENLNDIPKSDDVDEFVNNKVLNDLQNDNNFDMIEDNDNDLKKNKQNDNKFDFLMLNEKRFRRDGKHEHPYGARVLRGMVDEFSIFPSELSRLQILVLKTHCKVYYNKYVKKPSTQSKESYSEIKANSLPSYNQQAMPYAGQQYQPQASYNQAPSVSSNYPNYQSGSNQKGYYGNYGYQPATTGGQTGYQRSQGYKRPSLSKGPTSSPTYAPRVLEPPSYVPKSPSYVPQRPANAQGTARWGIPERAYQIPNVPSSTVRYPYIPTYKASDGYTGYPKSYTPQGLAVKQAYNPQWSAKRQDQFGYPRTQTPGSPVSYRGSTNTPQYQPSVRSYNGYRVTQAGRMSQLPQNTQNMVYPQGSREAYNSMPSRQTNSDTQSNRYVPMNVPKYNTNQYARNIPNGQYQIVSPTSGQQRVQYGQQDNQYSGGTKSFIAQNPSWQTDVPKQMTSSGDVTSMTYANDMPQAQTAYTRNNVYANAENYGANTQNNPASYAAATRSITPQYGPNYAYSAGLSFDQNSVRGNIPRPTSSTPKSYVTKKPQNQQNLRTLKGQNIGPSESKNKLSRINTLDEHGQYPSDVKRYKPFSQLNGRKLGPAQGNAQSNRWSARSRTPWASVRATKMGSGTGGIQGGKPEGTWNSGTFAKSYTQLGWPRQRFRISPIYARVQPRRQQARTQDPYRRQNVHGTAQNLAMVDPNVYKRIEIASRQSKVNFRFPRKDKAT